MWLAYNGLGGSVLGGFHGATITTTSGLISGQTTFLTAAFGCVTLRGIGGYYPCIFAMPTRYRARRQERDRRLGSLTRTTIQMPRKISRSTVLIWTATLHHQQRLLQKVNQTGQSGNPPSPDKIGWSVEESLDLDMVSAICPNCHILLVEADTNSYSDLGHGVDEGPLWVRRRSATVMADESLWKKISTISTIIILVHRSSYHPATETTARRTRRARRTLPQ